MNFIGSGQVLSGADFARAAKAIGCEENVIRAVTVVEARGQGFDAKKRPVILFEPHVFYRCLPVAKRDEAEKAGLAYPKWKPGNYPGSQDGRYLQLFKAMQIDEDAALKACSWGLGQVLGENWKMCGFSSVQAMVEKCVESEGGQLDVMVAFIIGAGLARHLKTKNWKAFAAGYNGPGYAKNAYDTKLASAYAKLQKGAPAVYDPLSDGLLSMGDKGDPVKSLQIALGVQPDGDFGQITHQAVVKFQTEHGITADGKVGRQTGIVLGLPFWPSIDAPKSIPATAPKPSSSVAAPMLLAAGTVTALATWWQELTAWVGGFF